MISRSDGTKTDQPRPPASLPAYLPASLPTSLPACPPARPAPDTRIDGSAAPLRGPPTTPTPRQAPGSAETQQNEGNRGYEEKIEVTRINNGVMSVM